MQFNEKKELIERIGKNLQYCIENRAISQLELIKSIKEKRGLDISQPYLSRIINGNLEHIPALVLVTICEALEVDIQKLFWENMNEEKLLGENYSEKESKLVFVDKESEFEKYLGKYHCYFFPTISSETMEDVLYGRLEFQLDQHTKECKANFILYTNTEDEETPPKEYRGRLLLSNSYNCCYCYLVNEVFGEVSFLLFEGFSSNSKSLSCRMAAVLTPSAGGTRDATCHRMFLSKKKLSQLGLSVVMPHLKINTAEIYITEENLKEFYSIMEVPEKFQKTINCLTEPEKFYVLREEHFWGFNSRNMKGYNKFEFITKLREYSNVPNYHKIGKKVDDMLYNYMYKAKDKNKFFE